MLKKLGTADLDRVFCYSTGPVHNFLLERSIRRSQPVTFPFLKGLVQAMSPTGCIVKNFHVFLLFFLFAMWGNKTGVAKSTRPLA